MASERVPLIAGNWKMYTTIPEARDLATAIVAEIGAGDPFRVGLFPPAICLGAVAAVAADASADVLVGAQNMHFEARGAFTGENSAEMILSAGAAAVLLGHSERRHVFGEADEAIARKVRRALEEGLTPVICVGEKLDERDADRTTEVVGRQLAAAIAGPESASELARIIVAYEPVWAIGTGRTASPEQAQEVHGFIRAELARAFSERGADGEASESIHILYGGSVKPENAKGLLEQTDIDGALVGGASLKAETFLGICSAASTAA